MEQLVTNYLDVSPMISALRTRPADFEIKDGWLQHFPSRHNFKFDPDGHVRIESHCDCSLLAIKQEQKQELCEAFREWKATYWRALQINKEFASHFRPPNVWGRIYRFSSVKIRRLSLRLNREVAPDKEAQTIPAE